MAFVVDGRPWRPARGGKETMLRVGRPAPPLRLLVAVATVAVWLAATGWREARSQTSEESARLGTIATTPIPEAFEGSEDGPGVSFFSRPDGRGKAADGSVSMFNDTARLRILGTVSALGIFSTDRPFVPGNPFFLAPASPYGLPTNTVDIHARQSNLTMAMEGPDVGSFESSGVLSLYLMNANTTSDTYGVLPAQAYGQLANDEWRFLAGLYFDVFAPRDPVTLPLSMLAFSGNPGTRRAQLRVERYYRPSTAVQHMIQADIGEPLATFFISNQVGPRIIEDNGWPNVEARYALGLGEIGSLAGGRRDRPFEVGLSGVVGQLRNTQLVSGPGDLIPTPEQRRFVTDVYGVAVDAKAAVSKRLGAVGELYMGQGLREYGACIGQAFNSATYGPVRSRGGWFEGYWFLSDQVHMHSGYGIDSPYARDLAIAQISANQTFFNTLVFDITRQFQWSIEVDYRRTNYIGNPGAGNIPFDARGMIFYTQFLWRFGN